MARLELTVRGSEEPLQLDGEAVTLGWRSHFVHRQEHCSLEMCLGNDIEVRFLKANDL